MALCRGRGRRKHFCCPKGCPLVPPHVQFPKLWRDLNTDLGDLHIEELYGKSLGLLSSLPWGEKSEPCSVLAVLSSVWRGFKSRPQMKQAHSYRSNPDTYFTGLHVISTLFCSAFPMDIIKRHPLQLMFSQITKKMSLLKA